MIPDLHKHIAEPRSVTIIRHVTHFILVTSTSRETYSQNVVDIYHERTPNAKARVMRFHTGGDVCKDREANDQLVRRILNQSVKFPADIEEAFVLALPEQYRRDLLTDLSERYGLLPAYIPKSNTVINNTLALSSLMTETADVIQSLGPIMADGLVDEKDSPLVDDAIKQIHEAVAELKSWESRLHSVKRTECSDVVAQFPSKPDK